MRKRIFTLIALAAFVGGFGLNAQDTGTGPGWETLNPGSPQVLNEDFTGFEFYGNWAHADDSNSKDATDPETLETIPANIGGSKTITYESSTVELVYTWDSCAFAPEWGVAKSVDGDGNPVDPDPTTPGVSDGFVEVAREGYGTLAGEFTIDLRNLEFVEAVQYSHSSCGGKRRGLLLMFSLDDGTSWDTLRYQPGDGWGASFTKDPFTLDKTPNEYSCEPSAYGMLWEDAIYSSNVMLQFRAANSQALRIHDLKVYGDLPTSNNAIRKDAIKIYSVKGMFRLSEAANVDVYNLNGKLIKTEKSTNQVDMGEMSDGIYLVKVQKGDYIKTSRLVLYK